MVLYLVIVPAALSAFNPLGLDSEPGLSNLGGGRIKMGQREEETRWREEEEERWL